MHTLLELNHNKRARLLGKGILPTTITGHPYFDHDIKKSTASFPHLLTAIGEEFSIYRCQGLQPDRIWEWVTLDKRFKSDIRNLSKASPELSEKLSVFIPKDDGKQNCFFLDNAYFYLDKELSLSYCELQCSSHDRSFMRDNDPVFLYCQLENTQSEALIEKKYLSVKLDPNYAPYKFLTKLILKISPDHPDPLLFRDINKYRETLRSSFDSIDSLEKTSKKHDDVKQNIANSRKKIGSSYSNFFDISQINQVFNETTIAATYNQLLSSLIEKMKDNLHQLFIINPCAMRQAMVKGNIGLFCYHFLAMGHALFSIPVDLAVEATALVTRTVKQGAVSGYARFFSSEKPNEQVFSGFIPKTYIQTISTR